MPTPSCTIILKTNPIYFKSWIHLWPDDLLHVGVLGTFTRFYPHMQRRYDYGCMFSVATFSLVTVSGDKYLELVKQRVSTIMVSVATVMVISLVICPVWAGKDLHKLIGVNLEKLASFLDGMWMFLFYYL